MNSRSKVIAGLLAMVCLTACGTESGEDTMTESPGANRTSSPSPSASAPVSSPPAPFDMESQKRATAAYPADSAMPSGWVQVDPTKELPDYPGDPVYCGVKLEKETARGAALHLYRWSDAGPYVLQYTFVMTEPVAQQVLTELDTAVQACIASGRDDDGKVFAAKSPPTVGDQSVSMAFIADKGAVSQVTVFRRGDAVVALVGFNQAGLPPWDAIAAIAGGVDAKLRGSGGA